MMRPDVANLSTLESLQKSHGHSIPFSPVSEMSVFNAVPPMDFENPDGFDLDAAVEIVAKYSKAVFGNDESAIAFWKSQFTELEEGMSKAPDDHKWDKIRSILRQTIERNGGQDIVQQEHCQVQKTRGYSAQLEGKPEEIAQIISMLQCHGLPVNGNNKTSQSRNNNL